MIHILGNVYAVMWRVCNIVKGAEYCGGLSSVMLRAVME